MRLLVIICFALGEVTKSVDINLFTQSLERYLARVLTLRAQNIERRAVFRVPHDARGASDMSGLLEVPCIDGQERAQQGVTVSAGI